MSKKVVLLLLILIIVVGLVVAWQMKLIKLPGDNSSTSNKAKETAYDDTPVELDTSSEKNLESSIDGKSPDNILQALQDEMDKKIKKKNADDKSSGLSQIERVCGLEGKPPCQKGFMLQDNQDPLTEGATVKCCVIDPNRNDPTKVQIALELAKEVGKVLALEAGKTIAKKIAQKVMQTSAKQVVKTLGSIGMKIAAKVAMKVQKVAAKAGIKAIEKVASRVVSKLATKLATKAAAKGAAIAVKAAAKAGMGPLGWASMAFDVFSAALDYADPGGYNNTMLLDEMKENRDKTNEIMNNALASAGISVPLLMGPLMKLPEKNPNPNPGPEDPPVTLEEIQQLLMQEYSLSYAEEHFAKLPDVENYSDQEREEILLQLSTIGGQFFDGDEGREYLETRTCEFVGGVYKNKQCMYKDKETCDKSYNWQKILDQIKDPKKHENDPDTNYAEWRFVRLRDKTGKEIATSQPEWMCMSVDPSIRSTCKEDGNDFEYNYEKQLCKIDDIYCRKKGMDPVSTPDGTDCKINTAQNIAEMIFGTTITRGMIQVFDPAQYKPCKAGDYDMYNVPGEIKPLLNAIPIYGMLGNKLCVTPSKCPPGKVLEAGLCYDACKEGYKSDGALRCYKEPPAGWPGTTTLTHLQHKTHYSPAKPLDSCGDPNFPDKQGAVCYPRCRAGYDRVLNRCWAKVSTNGNGVGHPLDKRPCGPDQRDDGTVCWAKSGEVCGDNCAAGWDGCKHRSHRTCSHGPYGEVCAGGDCIGGCRTTCSPVYLGARTELHQRTYCSNNREQVGALCYDRCPAGTERVPGMPNQCRTPGEVSYYSEGKPLNCAPGREQRGALCYDKCDGHNTATVKYERRNDNIENCSTICPPGNTNIGIGGCQKDAYNRPVGKIPFSIYIKERLVPYGKK